MAVESAYYRFRLGAVCCHHCGSGITTAEALSEINTLQTQFGVVKPSCGRNDCPSHITQRKKAPKAGKAARKAKRKRVKDEVKQEVSKHRKLNDGSKSNLGKAQTPKNSITNYFKKK